MLATLALHMQAVAVGWQLYDLTGSALDLGLLGLVQFGPTILLTPLVGQVADRYNRRVVVTLCHVAEAGAAAALGLATLTGWLDRHGLFAIMALAGAARTFENPSRASLLPQLVPMTALSRAIAAVTSAGQAARIVGPALGGFMYALGPKTVYATVAVLYLCAALLIALVATAPPLRAHGAITLESFFSGLEFIRSRRVILGALTLDFFAATLGGITALLPIYARDILGTGPWGLGLLRSATACGALVMALILSRFPIERRVGPVLFGGVIAFGAATVVFGLSSHLGLSLAALAALGASDLLSVVIRHSLVQIQTPDEVRGRVSAVNSLFTGSSNYLGEFQSGVVASLLGPVAAVAIGGLGAIAVAGLWMSWFPELRRVRLTERVS